ncbi:uncharacterized protein LOC5519916 isoform X1 [Nematostella vectensis]|uniref:uncharacterized protein LOC5519916 isoform X1 n=1 Tax=Nematostella vectensis TaxID=45351 RepID=UPI002077579C|nr:uncharacterized protein LOC5519916 isoform X1 [Nematostella vectensis]
MWKGILVILAVGLICVDARASVKAIRKPRQQRSHAEWIDDNEEDKRDAIRKPNAFGSYQYPQAAPVATAYNAAARSTAPSSSNTGTAAAPAQAFAPSAPVAAPAQVAAAPAPAAAAPAPAPAAAAPAPAPAAPSAAAAPAPVRSVPSTSPSSVRSATPYYPQTQQQQSSVSSSYSYYPRAAPSYYYSPPAPAAYAPSTATATVAAAVAQAAKSTLTYAGSCYDDNRAEQFCRKATIPCYCAENQHFMYSYCRRACNWCDNTDTTGQRFWRIVNAAPLQRSWFVQEVKLFQDTTSKQPVPMDGARFFASSSFAGYLPDYAFDGKNQTYWLPDGWVERPAASDYIGVEFPEPVVIESLRVIHSGKEKKAISTKMYLQSSSSGDVNAYTTTFIMNNNDAKEDVRFYKKNCPIFWRRYETDNGIFCYKTVTELKSWQESNDKCQQYGAELTSITNQQEADFISKDLKLCGFTWIGLNDKKNLSHFQWTDGSPVEYKAWAWDIQTFGYQGDSNMKRFENCVALEKTGGWRPFHCDDKFYSICKLTLLQSEDEKEIEAQIAAANRASSMPSLQQPLDSTVVTVEQATSGSGSGSGDDSGDDANALPANNSGSGSGSAMNDEPQTDDSSASGDDTTSPELSRASNEVPKIVQPSRRNNIASPLQELIDMNR